MVTIFAPVLIVGLVIVLIIGWRLRAPGLTSDPPGMRTFASFARGAAPAEDAADDGAGEGAAEDGAPGGAEDEPAAATMGADEIAVVAQGLAARGVEAPVPYAEKYGHACEVTLDGERFRVQLGYVGDEPEEFLLTVEPLLAITAWREGRYQGRALGRLLAAIDESLRELEGLRELRWHRREDWSEGRYDAWAARPIDPQ